MKPQAKSFRFCGYDVQAKKKIINFHYRIAFTNRGPLDFVETILLPTFPQNFAQENIHKFLEPLHLILGVSYYKLYCPPQIETTFDLSQKQADFWNIVYRKGLGEFLYRNSLDPRKLAKFPYSTVAPSPVRMEVYDRALVGIGGGKDSIVAAGLLKNFDTASFLVETQRNDAVSISIVDEIGKPSVRIRRLLDPKLFEKYEGAYNGHIPISAVIAFLGLFIAALHKFKYVIVANEHSSDFGNLRYRGEAINHQWSKSIEFETLVQEYTKTYMTKDIIYFSLLRQFYEIRIAKLFAEHKNFYPLFSSCNRRFTAVNKRSKTLWCGECPKCAFVFLVLAPFLKKRELLGIFQKNLLTDESLLPLYRDLLGFGKRKPFDCVGTFEEARAALFLSSKKYKKAIVTHTLLPRITSPQKLMQRVFQTTPAATLPTPFRFLGIENVCILGYGTEGKISEKYIRKTYPNILIRRLDQNVSKDYLHQQRKYDLAIKTPGIPKKKVLIPYVTATNIFFSQTKNFTIGVTGSKGKSTTARLIGDILKTAGKKVRVVGNIGKPMLQILLERVDPAEIFIIELSSFMLEDAEYSPNIALLLNLFPEHMDYHGGLDAYYRAKMNIFRFQKPGDVAVHPPFTEKIPLNQNEIPLRGAHNRKNIQAAIKVARLLNVSDAVLRTAIKNFQPLPHRLEFVGTFNEIEFYDDAISTTPESTMMAIKTLRGIGTIFLGGKDRGYDFRELEKMLRVHRIRNIVLFPDSGNRMLQSRAGFTILNTRSMSQAVQFAFRHTPKGHICLLSTASPSYSLWRNFEEKGDLFKYYIQKYSKSSSHVGRHPPP